MLLVGSSDDLLTLRSMLAVLPADAYGQVLVETAPGEALPLLDAPGRVTVQAIAHGTAGEALELWVQEWLPHEPDARRAVGVWIGATSSARETALDHGLGALAPSL